MSKHFFILIMVCGLLLGLTGCASAPEPGEDPVPVMEEEAAAEEAIPANTPLPPTDEPSEAESGADEEVYLYMSLTSPAFNEGEAIPLEYSCDGENISPDLDWFGLPDETVSLTLIVVDPDAPVGTWDHWVLFNIPADIQGLQKGILGAGVDGNNSWDRPGYGGPCPPTGTHRYFFKLYALDINLDLPAGSYKAALEEAMVGHILADVALMGTYTR